jgi:DNA helicase HerA-like ATPase
MTLFPREQVVGTFLGFSEGGLEFHADILLPYRSDFQRSPMHGQFVLVALEHEREGVLGRITNISSQGRLTSDSGEDYAIRAVKDDRAIPEDLRNQYLRYRVDIRILGVLRQGPDGEQPVFVASHRRLPHVGSKVAFLGPDLLRDVAGHNSSGAGVAELGFLAMGEFVYSGGDARAGSELWLQSQSPAVTPKFHVDQLVSRRSFVFARAGFGKSNLVKLLFAKLYSGEGPQIEKRHGRKVPVGTVIFDPDGEYFWPDDKGRPALCDVPEIQDKLVVFTDREAPTPFYGSFIADKVKLDIRQLAPAKVIGLAITSDRQDQANVQKLKALRPEAWRRLVDAVHRDGLSTDLGEFYTALQLKENNQEVEALAARGNMVRVVSQLHDPRNQLLELLKKALSRGCICVVDISRMRGSQGLAFAGVILQHLFEHNQDEFTKVNSATIPTIAVIEEAQSVLGHGTSSSDGPFVEWVKEGRKYDLGAMLITQQPGSLPQELLSQGDNWFVFHLLSSSDLRALQAANSHFSADLLSSLLNEPIPGHGIAWSSAGATPYPIPIRALSFEATYRVADPNGELKPLATVATELLTTRESAQQRMQATLKEAGTPIPMVDDDHVDNNQLVFEAALAKLRVNDQFLKLVGDPSGAKWGTLQSVLSRCVDSSAISGDAFQWAYDALRPALDRFFGSDGWSSGRKADTDGSQKTWVQVRADRLSRLKPDPGPTLDLA